MIRIRTVVLLLTGIALLVIWYFVGGKDLIAWEIAVRDARAGGWDISGADRYEHPHPLHGLSLITGTMLFLSGLVSLVTDGIRRTQKAMNDRNSQAS